MALLGLILAWPYFGWKGRNFVRKELFLLERPYKAVAPDGKIEFFLFFRIFVFSGPKAI